MTKYDVGGSQTQYQPGSNDEVLLNKQGITNRELIDDFELFLLGDLYEHVLENDFPNRQLTVADIKHWHKIWLGNVYDWAGLERSVNMGKGDFEFAAAQTIPKLLEEFEVECLARFTPCGDLNRNEVVSAIARTHAEFILIHPFREGNGRISRLLADVMAVQAGYQPFDYSVWDDNKDYYFASIQAAVSGDYSHLERLVGDTLQG